jgi:hypothetical protein
MQIPKSESKKFSILCTFKVHRVNVMDIGMIFELVRFSTKYGNNFTTWIFWTIDFFYQSVQIQKGLHICSSFQNKNIHYAFNSYVFCLPPLPPQKKLFLENFQYYRQFMNGK